MPARGSRRSSKPRKRNPRRVIAFTGIAALLVAAGAGVAWQRQQKQWEDEIRTAESQRAELLHTTVPKSEFWAQVERKGVANKAAIAAKQELAALTAQVGAHEQELVGLAPQQDSARSQREQMAQALTAARAELERARGEADAREAVLRGFRDRTRAPEPGS